MLWFRPGTVGSCIGLRANFGNGDVRSFLDRVERYHEGGLALTLRPLACSLPSAVSGRRLAVPPLSCHSRLPPLIKHPANPANTAGIGSRILTPPPQPPAPIVAVRAFYGETTVKRFGNSSAVSACCGKSGPSLRTVAVFASAAHVATKRMLADNTRSVLDKLSVMMRSSLEGTAFFGHTFQTSAFKLREHVDSFCSKRNSTWCQNASNFLTGRIPQQSLAVTFPPPPALATGSN